MNKQKEYSLGGKHSTETVVSILDVSEVLAFLFVLGGYNGLLSINFMDPLANAAILSRKAWMHFPCRDGCLTTAVQPYHMHG